MNATRQSEERRKNNGASRGHPAAGPVVAERVFGAPARSPARKFFRCNHNKSCRLRSVFRRHFSPAFATDHPAVVSIATGIKYSQASHKALSRARSHARRRAATRASNVTPRLHSIRSLAKISISWAPART